jgi:hypothetical protein
MRSAMDATYHVAPSINRMPEDHDEEGQEEVVRVVKQLEMLPADAVQRQHCPHTNTNPRVRLSDCDLR